LKFEGTFIYPLIRMAEFGSGWRVHFLAGKQRSEGASECPTAG
jgi:hypothetical protein